VVSLPQISPPKSCMHFTCPPYVPHDLTTTFLMISSGEWYLVSTEHEAPVIYFLYSPVTLSLLGPNIFHSTPHQQPTFLPQCGTQGLAAMQSIKNCYSICFNLCVFGHQTGRQKILHRMIVNIPWRQSALNFIMNGILNCQVCSKYLAVLSLVSIY